MPPREDPFERAKSLILEALRETPWFSGVGIARVGGGFGLVLSVRRGTRAEAEQALAGLPIEVPVEIRETGPVRPRGGPESPPED